MDPTTTGPRTETPSKRPCMAGRALAVAVAAPVLGGDEVLGRGAAAAQVLGAAGAVDQGLGRGVGVHRGQQGLLDAELPVQDLHQRGDVVGGAAGAGDDLGLAVGPVDAVDDGWHVRAAGRAGQHYPSGPGAHVLGGVLAVGEPAGALQHQVDLEVDGLDLPLVASVDGVVFEQ
jgi:hypothetical protein